MRQFIANTLKRIGDWIQPTKTSFEGQSQQSAFIDHFNRLRPPSQSELINELKNVAFTCATINSATCASHPPKLFVSTSKDQTEPKCLTKRVEKQLKNTLKDRYQIKAAEEIEEVLEHPLLTLLRQVNPVHNAYDLWELTTLYQEVNGNSYWHIQFGSFNTPETIWPLPSHNVRPHKEQSSNNVVDWYEVRTGNTTQRLDPSEVIHFRYPDPKNPYTSGLSPLRAAFESIALSSMYLAYKRSIWDNHAMPGVIISPQEVISEEERRRLEIQWLQRFRQGNNGKLLVADASLNVDIVQHSLGDIAALAEAGATQADIANSFGVPLPFLTTSTNLANLSAAERQHATKTIYPRLQRRDEKINERLIPMYDPSGRLFVASDDPRPDNTQIQMAKERQDLTLGVRTVNEVRSDRGLPPVKWGDEPYSTQRIEATTQQSNGNTATQTQNVSG